MIPGLVVGAYKWSTPEPLDLGSVRDIGILDNNQLAYWSRARLVRVYGSINWTPEYLAAANSTRGQAASNKPQATSLTSTV